MAENLDSLQEVVIKELLDYFGDGQREDGLQRAKMALGSLSTVARLRATKRVGDALQFHIASALAEDEEMLRNYITITLPHLTPAALLASKT